MISAESLIIQLLNGITLGLILALVSMGLTLIFGLMGVINFAHGCFYAFGAYFSYLLLSSGLGSTVGFLAPPIIVAFIGLLTERAMFRYIYELPMIYQLLLTFGLVLVFTQIIRIVWGLDYKRVTTPPILKGSINFGLFSYPVYRLFVLVLACATAFAVWLFLNKTNVGLNIRAGVQDRDMVSALGVNISWIFALTFALGAGVAGLAGVAAAPLFGVYPEMGMEIIIKSFVVVVVGGIGSFKGSIFAGLIVGMVSNFIVLFWPQATDVIIYVFMAIFLLVKRTGLFGEVIF